MKIWMMLFSHSGREVSELLEAFPNRRVGVFTNRGNAPFYTYLPRIQGEPSKDIHERLEQFMIPALVTLHGYNRILPPGVVDNPNLEIYNVHPGDTELYPELRGKDPQEKAIKLGLKTTGVIIHRVTNEVDVGEVVARSVVDILPGEDTLSLVDRLRRISVSLWISFLRERGV